MTVVEIRAMVARLSWLDTTVAAAFRTACGVGRELPTAAEDERTELRFYERMMRQRYGAMDNPRRHA